MNNRSISSLDPRALLGGLGLRRGTLFGAIIITALLAFELFNYSTTDYALRDLLGDLSFLGLHWATILSIAFCGIDFAGIARLFTPEQGAEEPKEVWYLFGAWLLAATMNAMLTWWGVSLAVLREGDLGNSVMDRETLIRAVPVFVAILVWLIRVLIIGTFSVAGDRLFSQADQPAQAVRRSTNVRPAAQPAASMARAEPYRPRTIAPPVARAAPAVPTPAVRQPRPAPPPEPPEEPAYMPPEPTYHPVRMSAPANAPNRPAPYGPTRSFAARQNEPTSRQ